MKGMKIKLEGRTKGMFAAVIVENTLGWGLDFALEAMLQPKGVLGHLGVAAVSAGAGTLAGEAVRRLVNKKEANKNPYYWDSTGDYIVVEF